MVLDLQYVTAGHIRQLCGKFQLYRSMEVLRDSESKNRHTLSRFIVIDMYSALTDLAGFTQEIKLRDRRARPQAEVEFAREARAGVKTIVEFITE